MREPSLPRRALAAGIGLFVIWELVFLPAANLIDLVPLRPGPADGGPFRDPYQERGAFTHIEPLQRSAEAAGRVLDFWAELTGQDQGWQLFAPAMAPHSMFRAVQLRFADGEVVEIRSEVEPADLRNPEPRAPLIHTRLFNHEVSLGNAVWCCTDESLARYPEVWTGGLQKEVRGLNPFILAWMKWRVNRYAAANPGRGEPTEVVVVFRYLPTPDPGGPGGWPEPVVARPLARWRPGQPADGFLPVECYDPVNRVWVRLRAGGES